MNVTVTIRPATHDELSTVISLGEKLHEDERIYEPSLTFNGSESYMHYEHELTNPDALIIVATLEDGAIVGYQYSYVQILDYLSSENRQCVLEALYVDIAYRGQGIGKLLTTYAQEWAIDTKNINRIATHIYTDNNASVQLHIKSGFVPYNIELIKRV